MGKRIYSHVVVVGIDGMGAFCNNTPTPNIDRIFKNECFTTDALSMAPTISAQNWGAMLLGAKPSVHGLTNESINQGSYSNAALPSLFMRIRQNFPDALICSCSHWNDINIGLLESNIGVETCGGMPDKELIGKILECVKKKPDFLFIQLDDVDSSGHKYTYGSPEHLATITKTDEYLGMIYDEYCNQGIIDDTLFLSITDHGGFKNGHGGITDTEKYIFFGAAGKTVIKHSKPAFMQTRDISAIVLYAFGIDIPEYDPDGYSSQIPEGIFSGYEKKYNIVTAVENIPETKPTPEIDSENGLYSFFNKDEIELAVTFDNNCLDKTGNHALAEQGEIKYYSNGVRGSYAELGKTGFAKIDSLNFSNKSFSVAFWVKMNASLGTDNPPVFANKSWEFADRNEPGICVFLCADGMRVHIGYCDACTEPSVTFPEEISGGWVHTVICLDKENDQLRFYYNFKKAGNFSLPESCFVKNLPLSYSIGNDGPGTYNNETHKMLVLVDDMIVFSKAVDENDVKKLEKYYE